MATDDIWGQIAHQLSNSALASALGWGAVGGAANALVTRVTWREAARLVIIGGLLGAGTGGVASAVMVARWDLPPEMIPLGTGVGSASFVVGIFGVAVVEVLLARIRAGHIPDDRDD